MEIEPLIFPPLPPSLLSKDPNCLTLDNKRLRAIYKELFTQIEQWFRIKIPDEDQYFDSEMINVKRLIDGQDISELLVLTEYILVIVVRGESKDKMINRILQMSVSAQTDLQMLIERAIEMSV